MKFYSFDELITMSNVTYNIQLTQKMKKTFDKNLSSGGVVENKICENIRKL